LLPVASFPTHYSQIILPFDAARLISFHLKTHQMWKLGARS